MKKRAEAAGQARQGLSIHLVQQRRGVPSQGHGRALDHGAGGRARRQPLLLFPPLSLLLLQPLLGHLPPVDGSVSVGPATARAEVETYWQESFPAHPLSLPKGPIQEGAR